MSTWKQLDLQTLGSQPVMSKNLPNHCFRGIYGVYLKLVKKNQKITTCKRLDLETLEF